jgi:hypothetical protein
MKRNITFIMLITILFSLTGCLYPDDRLANNRIPYDDQIQSMQRAVERYKTDNEGLLPIKTRDMSTPIYQKYPIDFQKLVPRYIQEPPSTAYESGGIYQYVLVDVETNPTVKLIDLVIADKIRELKLSINMYRSRKGYAPIKEIIANNRYLTIDYSKLGMDNSPYVVSPYTGNNLPFIMDANGEIYVDYSIDLFQTLQKYDHTFSEGDDIREILVKHFPIVPAYSVPYTIKNNEPIFLLR